jgi:beta-galactosidase
MKKRLHWMAWAISSLLLGSAPAASSPPYVWLEAEKPTRADVRFKATGWGHKEYLSENNWLQVAMSADEAAKQLPRQGGLLEYDFTIEQAGTYEVWNRIGFEFVRGPFAWRIDQSQWQTITPEMLTTDLMEVDFWCEVAWIRMGQADLGSGKHTLQIRVLRRTKEERKKATDGKEVVEHVPDNVNYVSDCICLYRGRFNPNSKHKPDADWQTAQDKQAAGQVFQLKGGVVEPAERIDLPLSGLWQVCRYDEQEVVDRTGPTRTLPDRDGAFWMAMPVPGDKFRVKPELGFCHRFVYRARIEVPAELAGRSFIFRFPSINMIASLHVNGQFCGWTKAMYAPWECDATPAMRPGQVNEVCVVIKDAYYAVSPKRTGKSCRMQFNTPTTWIGAQNWVWQNFDFPVGSDYAAHAGILEPPSLMVAGPVYAADVFAKPSVSKQQLGLEVTLHNPTSAPQQVALVNRIVPTAGGAAEKTFATHQVKVPAERDVTVRLTEPWAQAKLWWPDQPFLYDVITEVRRDDKVVDRRRTTFGFREWHWNGPQFKLNGVPWQLWADTTLSDGGKDPREAIAFWRASGHNMTRFWGQSFGGLDREQTLALMDREGILVRRSGIFDGQGANYLGGLVESVTVDGKQMNRGFKDLFDNWIVQLEAQVKAERNHPSIFIWSIENEITFINSRNLGMSAWVEPEIARGARAVMSLDPTRPAMTDGGNCLTDNSLPVNGVHYMESAWRDYPDEAYTLARAYAAHEKPMLPVWGKSPWQLLPDRPIFMGESYFLRGSRPSDFAQFGGESCFAGWSEATRRGAGLMAKMLAEGYRWHGVAAQHLWLGAEDVGGLHYNSWKPVCVFCRQWNWTFAGGSDVLRTLKVFNDTHSATPIEVAWELTLGGKLVAGDAKTLQLAPGQHQEYDIHFRLPGISARTSGTFVLTCRRDGREVFREVKPVVLIDPDAGPKPKFARQELVVIDPAGSVKARLKARDVQFTEVASIDRIPDQARVVVVGKDAIGARQATDPRWLALAGRGTRLLVLDQAHPLHYQAVPADLTPTDYVGRIAFSEDLTHPVFAGLDQADFFTWSGDHVVYRNAYLKATRGAMSLAHCDEQLGYSALTECPVNEGLMLLCQLAVGTKLPTDQVAARLFDNMLAYCAAYTPLRRQTAVVMDENNSAAKLLAASGLKFEPAADVLSALATGKYGIVVFVATPANLERLAAHLDQVRAFTHGGGWLMAWGLTPKGLAPFNRLVGVEHVLRPFELERVTLASIRDPILGGLTGRDVAMESGEQIFPWSGDKYMVDDEFTWIVDLDDIAPFCAFPGARAGDHQTARQMAASWPRNMVNGFTSADAWKLIYYMSGSSPRITLRLPREEEITDFSIVPNAHYATATKVNLYYDDDPQPTALTTKPVNKQQDFRLTPRKARRLTIELAQFDHLDKTTGIDNIWIRVSRSDDWHRKVKPLLNIGGLVKYPMGSGGLVLNQLRIKPSEPVPINAQKKQTIVTALLKNLHATFAGSKVLTLGNLKYQPVALNEQCNQYLTKDRGWYEGGADLAHLPVGQQQLAGVTYVVRDFRTSPVPSCVMLAGPGARGKLPEEVKALQVDAKADALFFLHTFNRVRDWRPPENGDRTPPAVFRYVVHYADGQVAEVPVRYGEGVDHWMVKDPLGLKNAAVAWAAPFPNDQGGQQAVVYQMQWNNPRPTVAIRSIDMGYAPGIGSQYGAPALLAITAATQLEGASAKSPPSRD